MAIFKKLHLWHDLDQFDFVHVAQHFFEAGKDVVHRRHGKRGSEIVAAGYGK